jgi:hypothetical protein
LPLQQIDAATAASSESQERGKWLAGRRGRPGQASRWTAVASRKIDAQCLQLGSACPTRRPSSSSLAGDGGGVVAIATAFAERAKVNAKAKEHEDDFTRMGA